MIRSTPGGNGGPGTDYDDAVKALAIRRVLLLLAALVFTGIAVATLAAPETMAKANGYTVGGVDFRNELRAIYVGLWLAQAVLMVVAARRVDELLLGDLAALLIAGQFVGRVISVVIDGTLPSPKMWPAAAVESLGALALMLARPRRAA